jgi:methyl-accepting chemotaxis protein
MLQTVFIEIIIVSLATAFVTLLISHKIAGPLYRLNVNLSNLGEGKFLSMNLRTNDQLQDISASYNNALTKLSNKIKIIKENPSSEESKKILDSFKLL